MAPKLSSRRERLPAQAFGCHLQVEYCERASFFASDSFLQATILTFLRPMPKQKDSDGLLDAADAVQKCLAKFRWTCYSLLADGHLRFLDWQEAKSVAPRFCELSSRPKSIKAVIQ